MKWFSKLFGPKPEPKKPWKILMPEDGWGDREVSFYCEFCDHTVVHKSLYLNMDWLLENNLTQAEFALSMHLTDHTDLEWDDLDKKWFRLPEGETRKPECFHDGPCRHGS